MLYPLSYGGRWAAFYPRASASPCAPIPVGPSVLLRPRCEASRPAATIPATMVEHEIRYRVPAEMAGAVRAEIARIAGGDRVLSLAAIYFDTPDGGLAAAGFGLRLRREGGEWVQTLKTASPDGVSRFEHNLPREDASLDLPALAGRPGTGALGDAAALEALQGRLVTWFETDIERRRTVVRSGGVRGGATVEVAFDQGRLLADGRVAPVCELEFELLGGELDGLWGVAAPWVARFGLTAQPAGKAQRGQRLREGTASMPVTAGAVSARPGQTPCEAYGVLFDDCFRQIAGNAAAIIAGEGTDVHVHQLRVGIRRLRSLAALFEGWIEPPPPKAMEALKRVFRAIGTNRDRDVYVQEIVPAIEAAGGAPPRAGEVFGEVVAADAQGCGERDFQMALLALQRQRHGGAVAPVQQDLKTLARARVGRWIARVAKDARRFEQIDDERRHALRKRIKRLRYAIEFLGPVLPDRMRALARPLAGAQKALGSWMDLFMARERLAAAAGRTGGDRFADGWVAARVPEALRDAAVHLARLARRMQKAD